MDKTSLRALPMGEAHLWLYQTNHAQISQGSVSAELSREELARANRFATSRLREDFMRSHILLRRVLAGYLGIDPLRVPIRQADGAKPVLSVENAPFDFNLSHSGEFVMIGVARHPIGVDVEAKREFPDREAIIRANFSPAEVAALEALPSAQQWDGFYACWTRKEAYVKAVGLGLSAPLDRFTVSVQPLGEAELLDIDGSAHQAAEWSLWGQNLGGAGWAACAVRYPHMQFRIMAAV